jgi:hypothetical protein
MFIRQLFCAAFLMSCGTEVGIMGYKTQSQDTQGSPAIDTSGDTTQPDDTNDTQVDDPNYGITGYARYSLRQVACPPCVGESQEISIEFSAEFHDPISDNHTSWLPQQGSCTENIYTISPSVVPHSVGASLLAESPTHTFSVPQVTTGMYTTTGIYEAQYARDTQYSVATDEGSFNFTSSHGFDFIEPYTLLWVDPSYAYDAVISKSGTTFTWGPTSTDSFFVVTVATYSWDGSQFLGRVDCAGPDNGYMTIPGNYFTSYPVGSLTAVHLARHKIVLEETEINNSFVETHTVWEVVGTGHIE